MLWSIVDANAGIKSAEHAADEASPGRIHDYLPHDRRDCRGEKDRSAQGSDHLVRERVHHGLVRDPLLSDLYQRTETVQRDHGNVSVCG